MTRQEELEKTIKALNSKIKSKSMCFVVYDYGEFVSLNIYQNQGTDSVLLNSVDYYDVPALNRKKIKDLKNLRHFIEGKYKQVYNHYKGDCVGEDYNTNKITINNLSISTKHSILITLEDLKTWKETKELPTVSNFLNGEVFDYNIHSFALFDALFHKYYVQDENNIYVTLRNLKW